MFSKALGRANPVTPAPASDTLLLETGVKRSGFKLVFTSKLTTANAGSGSQALKSFLFGVMRAQAATAVRGMIRELKLDNSKQEAVRKMAEIALQSIALNKAASRTEIDQLFLLASLAPEEGNPEDLVCSPSPVQSYARLRAQTCLADKLGWHPGLRKRYAIALLDYAGARQATLDKASQGAKTVESLELIVNLRGLVKSLETAVPKLPEDDPTKLALNKLLTDLKKDVGKLPALPRGR